MKELVIKKVTLVNLGSVVPLAMFLIKGEVLFHDPHEKASQVFNGFFTPVKENLGSFGPKSSWNTQNQYYL